MLTINETKLYYKKVLYSKNQKGLNTKSQHLLLLCISELHATGIFRLLAVGFTALTDCKRVGI